MKSICLLTIKNILEKILSQSIKSPKDLNINTSFEIALREFFYLGKTMYTTSRLMKKSIFVDIYTTRSNVLFVKKD